MDELEDQQRLIDTTVSKAFGAVRSRLGVQLEESHALKRKLEKQSEELLRMQQRLSNFDAVQRENEQLRKELGDLRRQHASATPQREYDELEQERDALIRDNQLKQKTIDSLRAMIYYEKTKSKDWWYHSRASLSSPSSPSRRESSLQQRNEVAAARHTSFVLGDIPAMSNQALLQKLASPLRETLTDAKSSAPLGQTGTEMQPSSLSVKDSVDEDVLPPLLATGKTEDLGGPTSFSGSDDGDSSSELLPTTIPPLPSSPGVRRSDESNLLHEHSDQSTTEYFSSDSTAPPSPPCLNQECNQEKLRDDLSLESLEVVSARPVGRKSGKYSVSTPSAKLARGLAGNAEEPVTLKSEPEESFQTAAGNTSGLMSTCNENLGRTAFNSPKRTQSPQILPAHGASSVLQIAEDEDIVLDNNDFDRQPAKSLSARRNEDLRPSSDLSRPRPLQEIKNYERVLPRTTKNPQPPTKKRRSNDSQEAAAIRIVAEEGEDHNRSRKKSPGKLASLASPARSNTSAYRRLGNLLEGRSPAKPVLTKPSPRTTNLMDGHLLSAAASTNGTMKDQLDNMRLTNDKSWEWYDSAEALLHSVDSQSPVLLEKKPPSTPLDSRKTPKAQHESHRSSLPRKRRSQDGPEDEEPFRSRPLHRLELGHFKVNPKANAGFDYAYTDVIRSRDQRKCLPGCTRPECCGNKFRALAGTLPKLAANETRFLEPDPSEDTSSQQSDNDLLLNFLGPGSEERIQTLTSVARENLLLEAKTKIAADRYGKMHRHAHERPNSPPGFWRTEMPDTQEEIANRLDAQKREREEVERRYREALKEEGRWMFADE
jgi:DNA repair protein endonuclease SAE2/CtIP C-terminus